MGGVKAFIDNDRVMTGTWINDVPVISPDMVETDDVIIICAKSFIDIERQIKRKLPNPNLSYRILPLLDDRFKEWDTVLLDSLNKLDIYREEYKKMFEKCADKISREILDCILNYRFTMKSMWLQKAYDITNESGNGREYFDFEVIKLSKDEVFVDCGGYIGDTVLEFVKTSDNIYKKIYYFEPNMKIYNKAEENLKNVHDVLLMQSGVPLLLKWT